MQNKNKFKHFKNPKNIIFIYFYLFPKEHAIILVNIFRKTVFNQNSPFHTVSKSRWKAQTRHTAGRPAERKRLCLIQDIYCQEYNCQAQIQIQIYLNNFFLAIKYTNLFGLTFFGEYEYRYIWIQFLRRIHILIYSRLPKMGEYECEHNFIFC